MNLNKLEKILSGAAFLSIWIVLAKFGSGPVFSDQLMYVNIGLNNIQNPDYGNRYFHVYLQKLFMALSPSPMLGARIFWGFLVALTGLLVYWNARHFFKHSRPLHGLLAVLFFFTYRFISQYCGMTETDITAMAMVTIFLTVYLYHLHSGRKHAWPVVAMGALVFLMFKTKETTLAADIFLVGLLFDDEGKFSFANILPFVKPFLVGLAGAVATFILLDSIFLHNPLFSINPATFTAVLNNYAYQLKFEKEPVNVFTYLLITQMVPFVLYLISGIKQFNKQDSPSIKIIWLFPLVLLIWMTLNMLKIPQGFIERFFFPILPTVAILAPQFLDFEWPRMKKEKIWFWLMLVLGGGLILLLRRTFMVWTGSIGWDYARFLESVFNPIVFTFLLILVLLVRKFKWATTALVVICILALMLAPLLYNQKYIFRTSYTGKFFNQVYRPFLTYQNQMRYSPGMQVYFSANVFREEATLSDNRDELVAMFNAYFDGRSSGDDFLIQWERTYIAAEINHQRFDYVLLTQKDWEYVQSQLNRYETFRTKYEVFTSPDETIVLLVGK